MAGLLASDTGLICTTLALFITGFLSVTNVMQHCYNTVSWEIDKIDWKKRKTPIHRVLMSRWLQGHAARALTEILTQTATVCTFTCKYTHTQTGAESRGTNVTHRILFIETQSRKTKTTSRLFWEHGYIALGRKCKWMSVTPRLFHCTWSLVSKYMVGAHIQRENKQEEDSKCAFSPFVLLSVLFNHLTFFWFFVSCVRAAVGFFHYSLKLYRHQPR